MGQVGQMPEFRAFSKKKVFILRSATTTHMLVSLLLLFYQVNFEEIVE